MGKVLKRIDWTNSLFLTLTPVAAVAAVIGHVMYEGFNPWTLLIAFFFYWATGMSITVGYHRLFAHRSFEAHPIIQFFALVFGAASFENSALKWCSDHRVHHTHVDTEEDPYNIKKGFFWAHIGWIMVRPTKPETYPMSADLRRNKLVMWQHRYYLPLSIFVGIIVPTLIGAWMGSPLGGLGIGALGRIVLVHHTTFFINSLCHMVGDKTFNDEHTARDSWITAIFTFGEGYHNFHHTFQADYRNGVRWYHFDPGKWVIKSMSWVGLTRKLKKVSDETIAMARIQMKDKGVHA